ncbi:DSBA-like thioredoxin domain-containing protein [Palleronia pelagia]|uniref:DSBA-like thioredoxin domain-containing protein n=2 Tax=Palleronia pelagia TaxID=387096 RepID=A0A1H8BCX0_9RHOB|nr:DSBA-like thioredoxin domain-containing protein [Palleronia pelagia]
MAAGGVALVAGAVPVARDLIDRFTPLPEFRPMADPPGFRRMAAGSSSLAGAAFVGLDGPSDMDAELPITHVRGAICPALYGDANDDPDTVPIASFSDFYCPYCRVQTKEIASLADWLDDDVRVVWHELPLLGDTSRLAAKAALAAKRQGAYVRFQEHLISSPFRATDGYLEALSESVGLDHRQLVADMNSADVLEEIRTSAALAQIFGFVGTPALVIGKTVIQGQIDTNVLEKIVALERAEGWTSVC